LSSHYAWHGHRSRLYARSVGPSLATVMCSCRVNAYGRHLPQQYVCLFPYYVNGYTGRRAAMRQLLSKLRQPAVTLLSAIQTVAVKENVYVLLSTSLKLLSSATTVHYRTDGVSSIKTVTDTKKTLFSLCDWTVDYMVLCIAR
jgi:hypothetical protein